MPDRYSCNSLFENQASLAQLHWWFIPSGGEGATSQERVVLFPTKKKTVLLKRNASCVGSELGQDLSVGGVGKLAPVHFDGKFLEIVLSFKHSSLGGQASHHYVILTDGAGNHARRHNQ